MGAGHANLIGRVSRITKNGQLGRADAGDNHVELVGDLLSAGNRKTGVNENDQHLARRAAEPATPVPARGEAAVALLAHVVLVDEDGP